MSWFFLFIIVKSLALLQKEGITNRDIKPENIILVKSHKYRTGFLYKISDFGIGCKLLKESSEVSNKTIKGFTKYFAAPEILAMNENSQKNPFFYAKYDSIKGDVFSLGITIMKMIDYNAKKERFLKDKEYFNKQLVGYEKLSTILQKMMEENPEKRINFIDLELLLKKQFNKREYLRKAKHVLPFFNVESNESKISNSREILKYDEKYLKIQEGKKKTKKQSIEEIIKLFYIHFNYFKLYDHKIQSIGGRMSKAKFHHNKAMEYFGILTNLLNDEKITITEENGQKISNLINSKYEKMVSMPLTRANLYNEMGLKFEEVQCFNLAEECFHKALKIFKIVRQRPNLVYADSNEKLGLINLKMRNLKKAENYYIKSLDIKGSILGENHEDLLSIYKNLQIIYLAMRDLQKAKDYFQKCLSITKNLYVENNENTASSFHAIGCFYKEMGILKKAELCIVKSLNIYKYLYGDIHAKIPTCTHNLGDLYEEMRNYEIYDQMRMNVKSRKYYLEFFKIQEKLPPQRKLIHKEIQPGLFVTFRE